MEFKNKKDLNNYVNSNFKYKVGGYKYISIEDMKYIHDNFDVEFADRYNYELVIVSVYVWGDTKYSLEIVTDHC